MSAIGDATMQHAARLAAIELCIYALAKTHPNPDALMAEIDRLKAATVDVSDLPPEFENRVSNLLRATKNYASLGKALRGGQ